MMFLKKMSSALTPVVFVMATGIGFFLAAEKPLWNDELYTQNSSIDQLSYQKILAGRIGEGNVTPLFYLTQKLFCDALGFKLPFEWKGEWTISDLRSQIIMRVHPNLCMSLAATFVFYFFARFYSVGTGIYALLVSLSSYMVWIYWVDARPYALWFCLTTAQILILLCLLKGKIEAGRALRGLSLIHVLLSLTVVLSVLQIIAVSLIVFLVAEKKWRHYVGLTIIPVGIGLFYNHLAPQYAPFWFEDSAVKLISANIPKDRLALMAGLGTILSFLALKRPGAIRRRVFDINTVYFAFFIILLTGTTALMLLFKFRENGLRDGFPLSNRYFIYLTPAGIIGTVLFSVEVVRALPEKIWLRGGMVIFLGAVTVFRLIRTWALVKGYYHF